MSLPADPTPDSRRTLWRSLIRHSGGYASVTMAASALTLVHIALLTRLLGLEGYGELVLVQAYIQIVWTVCNLSSWQPLVKLCHHALASGDREACAGLFARARRVDALSGLACLLLGIAGALLMHALGVWNRDETIMVMLYCGVLPLMQMVNAPTGYFRTLHGFAVLSWHRLGSALMLTVAVAACYALEVGVWPCVAAFIACRSVEYLVLYGLYARASRKAGLWGRYDRAAPAPGEWAALIKSSYIQNLAFNIVEHFDVFVAGHALGAKEAGMLRIIKSVAAMVHVVAGPLKQVFYPVISQVAAGHSLHEALHFGRRYAQLLIVAAISVMAGFLIVGQWGLEVLMHAPAEPLWQAACIYMAGACMALVSVPVMPLYFALGLHGLHQRLLLGVLAVYAAALVGLMHYAALTGIAMAYCGFYVTYVLAGAYHLRRWARTEERGE